MTTQPTDPAPNPPAPADRDKPVGPVLAPYRELGALALLGVNGLLIAFAVLSLLLVFVEDTRVTSFSGRANGQFDTYVGLVSIFFPLAAVLLATALKPAVPRARIVATGALLEYAVSALFGLVSLFAAFIQTVGLDYTGSILDAFLTLLSRLVWLVLLGFAAFLVVRVYQTLYVVPKPKPVAVPPGYPPGYPAYQAAYGQSGAYPTVPGYPQGYPQQQGYPQGYPPQAPGYPPQGYGQYPTVGYPPEAGSPYPPAQTGWAAPPAATPTSAPPAQAPAPAPAPAPTEAEPP
ncbi:MAG TPA: hypothetical protein VJT31_04505, partial [Rugosimonospora sp.]|nr:hypothetical protein [Rugosimonospora sp.]